MVYDNTQTLQSLHLHIPEEIIEEIMYRLPVKSLMRFKSVSKSWRSLIDSDRFIKNHYRINSTSLAHHRVIFNGRFMGMKHCSLQSMLKRPRIGPSPLDEEMYKKLPMTGHAWLVGCCNGLFCLVNNLGRYFLWNPATKIFFQLPDIPRVDISLRLPLKRGFGLDESSGAYKVFSLSSDRNKGVVVARVYSSKTNTWTTPVDHGSFSATRIGGVYACGCLHWVTTSCDGIECFDLKSEAFRKMEMPPDRYKYSRIYRGFRLGEVKGWLSVMRECTTVDLWVMKEHGVNESWSKLISFNYSTYDKRGFFRDPINGKMLIISGQSFWVCDDGGVKIRKDNYYERWRSFVKGFGFTGCWNSCIQSLEFDLYQTYLYVETLVSPLPHH